MVYEDVESIGICAGEMELNIYIFSERQTKTRSGAYPRNVRPIKPKAFPTPDLPRERDIVVVLKIYSEKRPESMNKPDASFYLGVNHTTKNSDKS